MQSGSATAHSHFRMGGEWNMRSLDTPTDSRSGSNPVLTATPSTIGREDHRLKMTIEKQTLMSTAIQDLLQKEAIEEIPFARMSFQSYMFPLHKHGKVRAVLDCSDLNQYIAHEHFKMESLPTLRYMIRDRDWLVKVDLQDAYLHVPLHPLDKPWVALCWAGKTYQFRAIPFGISHAPNYSPRSWHACFNLFEPWASVYLTTSTMYVSWPVPANKPCATARF